MTSAAPPQTDIRPAILRVHLEPNHGASFTLDRLALVITSLSNVSNATVSLNRVRGSIDPVVRGRILKLNHAGEALKTRGHTPKIRSTSDSSLLVNRIWSGSVWFDLAQNVIAPGGVGAASFLLFKRILVKGPGVMEEWAGLVPRMREKHWAATTKAWIAMAEATEAQARFDTVTADLEKRAKQSAAQAKLGLIDLSTVAKVASARLLDESGNEMVGLPDDFQAEIDQAKTG